MATILLQTAGAALGSVFGPVGAALGRAAGALAGSAIDRAVLSGNQTVTGARLGDARIPGAEEGTAITRAYGTVRIGGTLIWATRFEEDATVERRGAKGSGARVETFSYFANLALGICEGEIAGVRRVWADGRELDLTGIEMRIHTGSATQMPDPLIEAKQGTGMTPAYRGLAYAVFERLPLDSYGNRIPVIQFEVLRPVGTLERAIRAVTVIPGATEHGYNAEVVSERTGTGTSRLINRNVFHAGTDWEASMNELQALCPNLKRVGLVSAWFGTDLRAGACRIVPGVETPSRDDESKEWSVAGIARGAARVVSESGGGPAYGGTPSDESLLSAIADLKARGLKVYLYPFVLMDIPAGNTLPDPYGGAQAAAYPWRGRITCHPAPGRAGSADRTAVARTQVDAFYGGSDGYRRMVLHHAALAVAAGGVDGFIIGSEFVGLTRLRDQTGAFPFVEKLMALAAEVRGVLGSATKLTYAADWSEYGGYRPDDGTGDVFYNLDPLWASPNIDAVGIDNYLPLSDWRDEDREAGNPDGFRHAEDAAAMAGQIAGGEGYDWFYASPADRAARLRTPITDGLAGKPWVYRIKDIANWWGNAHRARVGGIELAAATAWAPGMKPVWFTETGCPAIDKGANQPNVFTDPKSAETAVPHFSNGNRADAMSRRYLDAMLGFWSGPLAPSGCVDPDHIFVWTWDARPQPAFPENTRIWADGGNWQTGHWLNGRLGAGTAADIIAAILADHGFADGDTVSVAGDLTGYVQEGQASARALIEPLMASLGIDAVEDGTRLSFRSRERLAAPARGVEVLADIDDEPLMAELRGDTNDLATRAVIDHFDTARDYERATARSRSLSGGEGRVLRLSLPGVLHGQAAQLAADSALRDHRLGQRGLRFALSPNDLALQPGDVVRLLGSNAGPTGRFVVTRIEDGEVRRVEARATAPAGGASGVTVTRVASPARAASAGFSPDVHLLDLPVLDGGPETGFARVAAFARPWRPVAVSTSPGTAGYRRRVLLDRPAVTGRLTQALGTGISGRFDRANAITLDLAGGELSSVSALAVLNGENRLAIRSGNGAWEIAGFRDADEIAPGRWRLTELLRGLCGTEDAMRAQAPAGAAAVLIDPAVVSLRLDAREAGQALNVIVEAAGSVAMPVGPVGFTGGIRALMPLAPVHLRARRQADGDIAVRWIRRARRDSDHWLDGDIVLDEAVEAYRVDILAGSAVIRSINVAAANYIYTGAMELADFGAAQTQLAVRVRQVGGKVGLGMPVEALLPV